MNRFDDDFRVPTFFKVAWVASAIVSLAVTVAIIWGIVSIVHAVTR